MIHYTTPTQRLDRQIKNIEEYCSGQRIEKIYTEKYTGTKIDRPQFSMLLKVVRPGDTIIYDSVSRMSRTAEEGYNLYMDLLHQDIDLVFLKEPHISTSYYKRMQARKYEIAHPYFCSSTFNAKKYPLQFYCYFYTKKEKHHIDTSHLKK